MKEQRASSFPSLCRTRRRSRLAEAELRTERSGSLALSARGGEGGARLRMLGDEPCTSMLLAAAGHCAQRSPAGGQE